MRKRTILVMAIGAILALTFSMQVAFAAAGLSGTFESNDGNLTKETVDDWNSVTAVTKSFRQ